MAIRLTCPHCRRPVAVTRRAAGSQAPCPVCKKSIDVPAPSTAICLQPTPAPVEVPAPAVAKPRKAPEPKPAPMMNYHIVAGAAAASLVFILGLVLICASWSGRNKYTQWPGVQVAGSQAVPPELPIAAKNLNEEPEFLPAQSVPDLLALAAPAEGEMKYVPPPPVVIARRDKLSDEDLRKQLLKVPQMNLFTGRSNERASAVRELRLMPLHTVVSKIKERSDLVGLPLLEGPDCQLGKEPAEVLSSMSRELRTKMGQTMARRPNDPDAIREAAEEQLKEARRYIRFGERYKESGFREASIPTAMQMLTPESRGTRMALVEHLASINDVSASKALAKIAIYDLSERVRRHAVQALSERRPEEFREVLVAGLRYPWAPVADHSAEALVVLKDTEALPELKKIADLPEPTTPVWDPKQKAHVSRELVRINHLNNCLMCHAPSKQPTDLVRGRVPTPGEPLPPLTEYYQAQDGIFVRADITYIRQDFSVPQPVDNSDAWPTMQRFDYVVRNRPLSKEEADDALRRVVTQYPQREAVLYAMQELQDAAKVKLQQMNAEVARP